MTCDARALARAHTALYIRLMSYALFIAAVVACIVVLIVLMVGVISFARGGEWHRRNANKIMRLRIITQAIAVVLIILAVLAAKSGG